MNPLLHRFRDVLNSGLALVYPETCQLCGEERATPEESFLCADCQASAQFIEPPFCETCGCPFEGAITTTFECSNCKGEEWHFCMARSAVLARDNVLEVIHRYKYQRALWFEPFLAELLIQRAQDQIMKQGYTRIVPVPLHPTKQREREFNQAERLAARLSRSTHVPLDTRLLRRTVATRTQTLLSRAERRANVHKAFVARAGAELKGESVVLVDDVFTTGATTNACASVLKSIGAKEVCVWTVARGI